MSLEHLGETDNNEKALILSETLDDATDKLLENKKSPSRKVNELDNRGSHFYLAMYWAETLANQNKDAELKSEFTLIYNLLSDNELNIIEELNSVQGNSVNIKGYYQPNKTLTTQVMRPSETFNNILS